MGPDEISYALAKQVPEIARVAVFDTAYGMLRLDPDESLAVAQLLERLLRKRLVAVLRAKEG